MAYFSTAIAAERRNPTEKIRVWGFFQLSNKQHPAKRRQPLQPRRKIRPTATKTASGIPYWPSRDPIGEEGGENLYGFVGNSATGKFDTDGRWVADAGEMLREGEGYRNMSATTQWAQRDCEKYNDSPSDFETWSSSCLSSGGSPTPIAIGSGEPGLMTQFIELTLAPTYVIETDIWYTLGRKFYDGPVYFSTPSTLGFKGNKVTISKNTRQTVNGWLAQVAPCHRKTRYYDCCHHGGNNQGKTISQLMQLSETRGGDNWVYERNDSKWEPARGKTVWESLNVIAEGSSFDVGLSEIKVGPVTFKPMSWSNPFGF